ncbi:hypothetical protein Lal_00012249 [Lupinus albus]|nr:hypothetical protein Lal_00012249 [Lupinus albus]
MTDRMTALEERMATMEMIVRQSLVEFRQSILEEFARVELPPFDGIDLVGWITRVELTLKYKGHLRR